ncbi:MAG: hypothetical protein LBP55_06305 [Candidatus Adiutrix sp.]|jgi:hypothetical protein|nr:hypothetical protein [Candidatus Adiutrix sp.]
MKNLRLSAWAGLLMMILAPAARAADIDNYMATPFWLQGRTIPQVMMVVERDWKLFYPAYNGLTDLDGDGIIDIGFNPDITYVGYFDSDSCYEHDETMFKRVGPTDKTQTADQLEALVPPEISSRSKKINGSDYRNAGIRVPRTDKHGVCDRTKATVDGQGQWHGNWLNFATTSRIDAIRKVLYGGKRRTDTAAQTVLELTSYLPANAHNWGGELPADNLWFSYAKSSPWYDIPSFTGYIRPKPNTLHFWCRSSHYTGNINNFAPYTARTKSADPLFMVAADVPSSNWHPAYKTPVRIWDWVGDHGGGSLPDDNNLLYGPGGRAFATTGYAKKPANQAARRFIARVQVCDKNNLGLNEDCRNYGASYKPIGLLQKYGETGDMYFGLLTGTMQSTTRWEGGVVRHHIQPFNNYVNYTNGTIKRPGLIDTIDRFTITGYPGYMTNQNGSSYTDGTQAGNPLGEMVFEAVRYLARNLDGTGLAPTTNYSPGAGEVAVPLYDSPTNSSQLPVIADWSKAARPNLGVDALNCPKPIILLLSEIFTDHDRNTFPNTNQLNAAPRLKAIPSASGLPATFSIDAYLDLITNQEKLTTALSGKHFFYAHQPRGTCTPDVLANGLRDINGHCPSEPSLEGGYSLSAVAYYAHTHDIFNLKGETPEGAYVEKPADLFAVGIPGNFPDITLTVDEQRNLTLMPITVARDIEATKLRTLMNFFVDSWEVDAHKRPFRLKFGTNFEYCTTPSWVQGGGSNNMERDVFNNFDIIMLTDSSTPQAFRETEPVFINSGPLRTCRVADNKSAQARTCVAAWRARQNPTAANYISGYYYPFKDPYKDATNSNPQPLDITNYNIVGVAIQNATLGSAVNMFGHGGYTISGVTRPGAYIEAGYDGHYYYYGAAEFADATFAPTVLTGDYNFGCTGNDNPPGIGCSASAGLPYKHTNPTQLSDALLTPWECPFSGYTNQNQLTPQESAAYCIGAVCPAPAQVCGTGTTNNSYPRFVQVRSFLFDTSATQIAKLPNPLWLAAKYGGFKDSNGNGKPDVDLEWKRGGSGPKKDDPYNYFGVENMSELPEQLGAAFEAIANSVATGTANSASINTVLGGGISIQTQYYTEYQDPVNAENKLSWVGSVYGLFVDKWGNLREDSNLNGKLDIKAVPSAAAWAADPANAGKPYPYDGEKGDKIVHMIPPPSGEIGMPTIYLCHDPYGNNLGGQILPTDVHPPHTSYPTLSLCKPANTSLDGLKTVWNAAERVSSMDADDRKIYTYYGAIAPDGNSDWSGGIEIKDYPFVSDHKAALKTLMAQTDVDEAGDIIKYIRGTDLAKYRNRTATLPWGASGVWRLGDVINSKPLIVGVPLNNYDLLYGDKSYAAYKSAVSQRRQVTYFGSNDGMLHAVNLGYFGSLFDGQAGYQEDDPRDPPLGVSHPLGAELWAYVPPSVLPHLQWLASKLYEHSYFVDLVPYIVDIKDGPNWRTIMLIGLRLGGRSIELGDGSISYSEFFALDVTDSEKTPKLLWRYSSGELGLSAASPTIVRQGDKWYAVLPSGPTSDFLQSGKMVPDAVNALRAYEGRSTQKARLIVLDALTGKLVRDRDQHPENYSDDDPLVVTEDKSFFNYSFTPLATNVTGQKTDDAEWFHHVVYLGLTSGDKVGTLDKDTGAVYRLQMAHAVSGAPLTPDQWKLARMIKTDKPVTGSVNSAYDVFGNIWVVFGTGRVWGTMDLIPCGATAPNPETGEFIDCCNNHDQYIWGLKEILTAAGGLTYAEIPNDNQILDNSGITVYPSGAIEPATNAPGYSALRTKLLKDDTVRGYKRKLESWKALNDDPDYKGPGRTVFEVVTTQPKIDALSNGRSNMIFTSYQTSNNICDPSGQSYLNVVDLFTGLPAPYMGGYGGFEEVQESALATASGHKETRITGVKNSGAGMASEAWVLKTGAGTVYGNTSFNSNRNMVNVDEPPDVGFISWREVLDLGFDLKEGQAPDDDNLLFKDLL